MGLSLKNVSLKVTALKENFPKLKKDKVIFEDFGEMLFTHFGISGPLVLSAASYISLFVYKERHKMISADEEESFIMDNNISGIKMEIDLKPALSIDELDKRILRDFDEFHNREFQNSLSKLLPRLLIPVIVKRSGIKAQKKVNEITAEERIKLRDTLKRFTLNMHSFRGFNEAIITGGGISVKEINPQTMELKKVKNLRVAGEVIDVDALTGGFNLQIAWSTAKIAAEI
jgi:predicted Rossmann fold flavoprotein